MVVPQETGLDLGARDIGQWWGGGPPRRAEQQRRDPPHLVHCTCCHFRAASLRLGHVGQWQRHGLQASVLLQSLSHVQQAQSRCVIPVPDHRPGPGGAGLQPGAELLQATTNQRTCSSTSIQPHPLQAPPSHALLPIGPTPLTPAHRSRVLTRSALASILAPVSPMALPLISRAVRLGLVARARSRTLAPSFSLDSATDRDCRGWG